MFAIGMMAKSKISDSKILKYLLSFHVMYLLFIAICFVYNYIDPNSINIPMMLIFCGFSISLGWSKSEK